MDEQLNIIKILSERIDIINQRLDFISERITTTNRRIDIIREFLFNEPANVLKVKEQVNTIKN